MNRRTLGLSGGLLAGLLLAVVPAMAQDQHEGHSGHEGHGKGMAMGKGHDMGKGMDASMPKCPVMGDPVNFAVRVATANGPVFFCCKDCPPKFEANPGRYAAKAAAQRQMLASRAKVQVTCPVSGDPADHKVFTERGGEKIYFCCKDCIKKFENNPGKYKAALANAYSYQTKCPVKGGEIDSLVFTTVKGGQKIYFCCAGCEKKLYATPDKYLPNLKAQGFDYQAKDMVHGDAKDADGDHDGDHDADGDHDGHGSHHHGSGEKNHSGHGH